METNSTSTSAGSALRSIPGASFSPAPGTLRARVSASDSGGDHDSGRNEEQFAADRDREGPDHVDRGRCVPSAAPEQSGEGDGRGTSGGQPGYRLPGRAGVVRAEEAIRLRAGEGKMAVATQLQFDKKKNTIVFENYSSEPVRLQNVKVEKS